MRPIARLALCALLASGCLPADDRPEPGSVLVNVARSDVATQGFDTDDGWHVSFDRFVLAIGDMSLTGDNCVDYSVAHYDRLYDAAKADTSKASLHYGLGDCTIQFSIRAPSDTALLMAGVTDADRSFMNTDAPGIDPKSGKTRVALMVVGRAEQGLETKRFSWLLRGGHRVGACYTPARDGNLSEIQLNAGDAYERELEVRPEELFRITPSTQARIEFGRFAQADADGDGSVTLEELAKVTVPAAPIAADLADELPGKSAAQVAAVVGQPTLASLVSNILSGRVVAFAGAGECVAGDRSGGGFLGL